MLQPFELFDEIKRDFKLKNDVQLARGLNLTPPQLSKVRNRQQPCSDTMILRIHEIFGYPVDLIRALLAVSESRGNLAENG